MIRRKLCAGLIAGLLVMLIYFLLEQSGFVILMGAYLIPILLFYGIPASILSDFITRKISGWHRGSLVLFIHLFLAALLVLIPILFLETERDILFSHMGNLLNLVFITAIISSVMFWCIDELIRLKK